MLKKNKYLGYAFSLDEVNYYTQKEIKGIWLEDIRLSKISLEKSLEYVAHEVLRGFTYSKMSDNEFWKKYEAPEVELCRPMSL